ncbi:MAG: hypothetical protein SGPRY_006841 [Prymnesium sp.]
MRLLPHEPAKAVRPESSRELCISIGGGAWASLFYLGFLQYLQTQFSRAMLERCAFCGESSGGVYALAACIGVPYEYLQDLCEDLVHDANQHPLGIVGRGLELAGLLVDKVLDYLPEEELVERLKGRFAVTFVALEWRGFAPYIAMDFESREEVRLALHASANLPGFMAPSMTPRLGGKLAFDAVLPCKRAVFVICVSPLSSDTKLTLWGAALPPGICVDVKPDEHVPRWKAMVTPRNALEVDAMRRRAASSSLSYDEFLRLSSGLAHRGLTSVTCGEHKSPTVKCDSEVDDSVESGPSHVPLLPDRADCSEEDLAPLYSEMKGIEVGSEPRSLSSKQSRPLHTHSAEPSSPPPAVSRQTSTASDRVKRVTFHRSVSDLQRKPKVRQQALTGMPSSQTALSVMMLVSIILTVAVRHVMEPEASRWVLPDMWKPHLWESPVSGWMADLKRGEQSWMEKEPHGSAVYVDEYATRVGSRDTSRSSQPTCDSDLSAADSELKLIVSSNDLERVDEALMRLHGVASSAALTDARRMRDRLKEKTKKAAEEARRAADDARKAAKEAVKKAAQRAADEAKRTDDSRRNVERPIDEGARKDTLRVPLEAEHAVQLPAADSSHLVPEIVVQDTNGSIM